MGQAPCVLVRRSREIERQRDRERGGGEESACELPKRASRQKRMRAHCGAVLSHATLRHWNAALTLFKVVQPFGFPRAHTNAYLQARLRAHRPIGMSTAEKKHGRRRQGTVGTQTAPPDEHRESMSRVRLSWDKREVVSPRFVRYLVQFSLFGVGWPLQRVPPPEPPKGAFCKHDKYATEECQASPCHVGELASLKPNQTGVRMKLCAQTNSSTAHLHHAFGSSSGVAFGRKGKNVCQLARATKESLSERACSYCSARKSVFMSSI